VISPTVSSTTAAKANPVIRAVDRSLDTRLVSGTHAAPHGLCGTHWFTVVFVMVSLPRAR